MAALSRFASLLRRRPATLPAALERAARRWPERDAFVNDEQRLSFAELRRRARVAASELARRGVARGERFALLLPNRLEWIVGFLAAAELGAVLVPLDTFYQPPELARAMRDCDVATLLCDDALLARVREGSIEDDALRVVLADELASWQQGDEAPPATSRPDDDLLYIRTSGSTGIPKGILMSQRRALAVAHAWRRFAPPTPDERCFSLAPLFRSPTLLGAALAGIYYGVSMILPASFTPAAVWQQIAHHRATIFHANPFHFAALADDESARDEHGVAPRLRAIYSTGNRLPPPVQKRFEQRFGVRVEERYGTSEVGAICKDGRPMRGVRIRIVDDEGRERPRGEVGEILVRTPLMATRYEGAPQASAEAFAGGWFHTGDMGRFEDDGRLRIVSRKKTAVEIGGRRVYADVVLRALRAHPDVVDAVVLREQHPDASATLRAVVVPRQGATLAAETIAEHCRARLSRHAVPAHIEIREELPRSWKTVEDAAQLDYPRWGEA
ncbi:MAG: acyl--CoA ligase [Myxococcales bacterium]|nr:acyl--CoA ligase [Myxococcales bacterium]